jgi:pimeloyl-ACP methyl ester carboxylesterase
VSIGTVVYVDGLAVYRRSIGVDGPRVVLVHGAMDRAAGFASASRHLRDLQVIRYDRRGYARSLDAGVASSMDALVDDLTTVMEGIAAAVVGHSLGALVALAAASRHPDLVTSVGAFEPPTPWMPWWSTRSAGEPAGADAGENPSSAAEAFMRRLIGDARWDGLPQATRAQRRAEGPALLADLASAHGSGPPFDLATCVVPVTLGYGAETSHRHRRAVRELAELVPQAETMVIRGASHGAHSSHGGDFARFVRRVVERGHDAA